MDAEILPLVVFSILVTTERHYYAGKNLTLTKEM